jgi:hypothetical protein
MPRYSAVPQPHYANPRRSRNLSNKINATNSTSQLIWTALIFSRPFRTPGSVSIEAMWGTRGCSYRSELQERASCIIKDNDSALETGELVRSPG